MRSFPAAFALAIASVACAAAPVYDVELVGPPPSRGAVFPLAVNDQGNFTALVTDVDGGNETWYVWRRGSGYSAVVGPGGEPVLSLAGINNADQVIGATSRGAFVWSTGRGALMLSPPTGYDTIIANAINDKGEVVGSLKRQARKASFSWTENSGVVVLAGSNGIVANTINDGGLIGATAYRRVKRVTNPYALRVKDATHAAFVGFTDGGGAETISWAVDINDSGAMAVNASIQGAPYPAVAAIWTKPHGLYTIAAGEALGIDDAGEVIGNLGNAIGTAFPGFVWSKASGVRALQNLLAPDAPAFEALAPLGISPKQGIICSSAVLSGVSNAAILTPRVSD